jgi:hypothetical protein
VDGLAHMIRHREDELRRTYHLNEPRQSVIDPSAAKSEGTSGGRNIMQMLQDAGIWFTRATNDRQSGWAQVRRFLETDRLVLWRGKAPYLRESITKLTRDPKKADDLHGNQDDHGADTLRYGLMAVASHVGFIQESLADTAPPGTRDPYFEDLERALRQPKRASTFTSLGSGF